MNLIYHFLFANGIFFIVLYKEGTGSSTKDKTLKMTVLNFLVLVTCLTKYLVSYLKTKCLVENKIILLGVQVGMDSFNVTENRTNRFVNDE